MIPQSSKGSGLVHDQTTTRHHPQMLTQSTARSSRRSCSSINDQHTIQENRKSIAKFSAHILPRNGRRAAVEVYRIFLKERFLVGSSCTEELKQELLREAGVVVKKHKKHALNIDIMKHIVSFLPEALPASVGLLLLGDIFPHRSWLVGKRFNDVRMIKWINSGHLGPVAGLEKIDLSQSRMTIVDLRALIQSGCFYHVRELNLSGLKLGDQLAQLLTQAFEEGQLQHLTTLNLASNEIGYEGARVIVENMLNVQTLNLNSNNICDEGVIVIAENMHNVTDLDLSFNNISWVGAAAIGKNMKNLIRLSLSMNSIGDRGVIELVTIDKLRILKLCYNLIADEGATAIVENMVSLIELDLSFNRISPIVATKIKNMIHLKVLNLSFNENIGDEFNF